MSDASKAVFLSYASQDAEAAQRIAEALRAAGVEVWFDRDELVGGDAWDTKIRKQIKECALFVPVISANTQARREGYFRLEWKLAAQRTHTMADGTPFLLPVVIDQTRDDQALVPEEFRAVQWTRLPGGEAPPAFAARVKQRLSEEPDAGSAEPKTRKTQPAANHRRLSRLWWVAPIFGVAMALLLVMRKPDQPAANSLAVERGPSFSEAQKLERQARALVDAEPLAVRETFRTAYQLCEKAASISPGEADVWATMARANVVLIGLYQEGGTARVAAARSQAEKALSLAPDSVEAGLAMAAVELELLAVNPLEVRTRLEQLLKKAPGDHRILLKLAQTEDGDTVSETASRWLAQAEAIPAGKAQAALSEAWIFWGANRLRESLEAVERSLTAQPLSEAYHLKLMLLETMGEPDAAQAWLKRIPSVVLREDRAAMLAYETLYFARKPEEALRVLQALPREVLEEGRFFDVRSLLAAEALLMAGKNNAAEVELHAALKVIDERLAINPRHARLWHCKGRAQIHLGDRAGAERSFATATELGGLWETSLAAQSVLLGRTDETLALMDRSLDRKRTRWPSWLHYLKLHPVFDPLHANPRYQQLLARAEAWLAEDLRRPPAGRSEIPAKADDKSIAVLPFTNLSDDKDSGYFADGVHEDVLTNLAGIRELRVVSRTSVMDYRGTTKKIPQIGRELNVAYVLEGSIRRAGNKVRVTGQLIRTATDQHVWAKSFDRDLTDIFAIQAELAKAIAGELNAALSPGEQKELTERPTENLAAYDLYLKSREIANRGAASMRDELQTRERLLQSAVDLDPKFVEAWCELVQAHVGLIAASVDTTPARLAKATAALDRARALAPDAPAVELAAGAYDLFGLRDLPRARDRFARLVDRLPNDVDNLNWLSVAQLVAGQWPDLLATQRRLTKLDPANRTFSLNLIFSLQSVRRYDEAMAECRRLTALRPDDLGGLRQIAFTEFYATGSTRLFEETIQHLAATKPDAPEVTFYRKARALNSGNYQEYLRLDKAQPAGVFRGSYDSTVLATLDAAAVYRLLGDDEGVRTRLGNLPATLKAQVELEPNNTQYLRSLAAAESILGHHAEALRCIERAAAVLPESKDARIGTSVSSLRARILAWAGDKDRAIAEIARLLQVPSQLNVHAMKTDRSWWAPLEDDPRFQALLRDPRNNAPLY